jgi:HEAT repeats
MDAAALADAADPAPQSAIEVEPREFARSDPEKFRQSFRRLREDSPQKITEASLWYIATHGVDSAARHMAYWLASGQPYFDVLLEPALLPLDAALRVTAAMKELDPAFFGKFFKAASSLSSAPHIDRALALVPAVGDCSAFYLLRSLNRYSDERSRPTTARTAPASPPNKALLTRRLLSDDPRIRSSALETIWHIESDETTALFRAALSDSHHRVVGTALVGLHLQGDPVAAEVMIQLSGHKAPLFRAAMAWALGHVQDPRATAALETLGRDVVAMVRKRALKSLLTLHSEIATPDVPKPAAGETAVQEAVTLETQQPDVAELNVAEPDVAVAQPETTPDEPEPAEERPDLFRGFSSYK